MRRLPSEKHSRDANMKAFNALHRTSATSASAAATTPCTSRAKSARKVRKNETSNEWHLKAIADRRSARKPLPSAQKWLPHSRQRRHGGVRRLSAELGISSTTRSRTLAADKACGREPAKPVAMVQSEQLNTEANALSDQIRQLEEQSAPQRKEREWARRAPVLHGARAIEAYLSAMK